MYPRAVAGEDESNTVATVLSAALTSSVAIGCSPIPLYLTATLVRFLAMYVSITTSLSLKLVTSWSSTLREISIPATGTDVPELVTENSLPADLTLKLSTALEELSLKDPAGNVTVVLVPGVLVLAGTTDVSTFTSASFLTSITCTSEVGALLPPLVISLSSIFPLIVVSLPLSTVTNKDFDDIVEPVLFLYSNVIL